MHPDDDHATGELSDLDADECLRLVATLEVGRIAVAAPGLAPLVVPVNYILDDGCIVFRSDEGSKLHALLEHPISFQVDFVDPFHHTGWSVLVQGVAEEIDPAAVGNLALQPWAAGPKRHWLRLRPAVVTGRRLHLRVFAVDARGYL